MNNKVAAISKMMELPGDNNVVRVLESKFLLCINKSWAIGIFVLTSLISLSNFITLDRKRNLQKPGILPSFNTDASMFGE